MYVLASPLTIYIQWWGFPIGLAGCGIWLFSTVIFGIWAENRSGKREAGITITSGSGISCFYRVGMRDLQGEQSGIRDYWKAQKPQAGSSDLLCIIAKSGFKWWIATDLYPVRFCQTYPLSLDYASYIRWYEVFGWLRSFVLTSDINDICAFRTFLMLALVILAPDPV